MQFGKRVVAGTARCQFRNVAARARRQRRGSLLAAGLIEINYDANRKHYQPLSAFYQRQRGFRQTLSRDGLSRADLLLSRQRRGPHDTACFLQIRRRLRCQPERPVLGHGGEHRGRQLCPAGSRAQFVNLGVRTRRIRPIGANLLVGGTSKHDQDCGTSLGGGKVATVL